MTLYKGQFMFLVCVRGKPVLRYHVRKNSVYGAIDAFARWFEKSRLSSVSYSVSCYRPNQVLGQKDYICWKQEFPQLAKKNRA